ncbi:hypothetical protein [Haloferax denitrificans]|uniref:Uncharacterized protein n=1 Tax=Haloferax denitrificans ATCC 35960 TaxID=662478 RepID=M0JJV0_9EURY|nr:hypothetical protein [Haloferax denitrificans]EMA08259.1 hypothetical protein C438_00420 [Haloferax denitrificans ATCC 35960]
MYNQHGSAPDDDQPTQQVTQPAEIDATERYVCSLIGLGTVAGVLLLFYPLLLAVTRPFQQLSITALVFVLVTVWLLVWLGTELVWEWHTGRLFP